MRNLKLTAKMKAIITGLLLIISIGVGAQGLNSYYSSSRGTVVHPPGQTFTVVATIGPLHSLAQNLCQGVTEVQLLLDGSNSPHHYQMKPSDRAKLDQADIIFWIGPELENFLLAPLANLEYLKYSEPLINDPHLLTFSHEEKMPLSSRKMVVVDPHVWLNPQNAVTIAEKMAEVLIQQDPKHEYQYRLNFAQLKTKLEQLDKEVEAKLKGLQHRYFLVYHDAYGYFTSRYNLSSLGAVESHSHLPNSGRKLQEVEDLIAKGNVQCIFSEPQYSSQLSAILMRHNNIREANVDILGRNIAQGKDAYFDMMHNISDEFNYCLRKHHAEGNAPE